LVAANAHIASLSAMLTQQQAPHSDKPRKRDRAKRSVNDTKTANSGDTTLVIPLRRPALERKSSATLVTLSPDDDDVNDDDVDVSAYAPIAVSLDSVPTPSALDDDDDDDDVYAPGVHGGVCARLCGVDMSLDTQTLLR
jgi:hypothetical protein